jgi:hypothetical protein
VGTGNFNNYIHVKVLWVVMPCSVVVGCLCFRGPCTLHLQSEVARMGENGIDIGPDWRGAAGATGQQEAQREWQPVLLE